MAFVYRILLRTALVVGSTFLLANSSFSQSLLYSLSGNGLTNTVYIFGTIHAIPQADFFIDDSVLEKLVASEKVYFEIDMDSPTMMAELQANMMMKGNSIDKLITEEEYNKLRKLMLDSLGLPLDLLKSIKPMLMSSFFIPKIVGLNPISYEAFIMAKAHELEKEILGIESISEQIGYIDSIPLKEQVNILMESVSDLGEARKEFRKLVDVYKSRDIEKISSYIIESSQEYQQFGNFLLVARNRSWIPRIVEIANSYSAFIAIGAGHLGGENGVVSLLRKEGYIVEEVK
jgi:hypothetical protein